jgi:hypothetical protein
MFTFDSKILISIKMNQLELTVAILALLGGVVYMISSRQKTKENFWMTGSKQVKHEKMFKDPTTQDFFQVPNFQGILSPRFSNVNYGANLRTEFPSYSRMGVPQDPLQVEPKLKDPLDYAIAEGIPGTGFRKMTKRPIIEDFNAQYGWQETKSLGVPKIPLDPHPYSADYANGDYHDVMSSTMMAGSGNKWSADTLATLDHSSFMTQDGEMKQPIIYDRYMFANRNSRLRGQGDPIRGDLPIVPISGNWFIPSAANTPNLSLAQGALQVLSGTNNETNNALANLIYNASGGTETTIGGVDMTNVNMSHQVYGASSAAMGDVKVTAFP